MLAALLQVPLPDLSADVERDRSCGFDLIEVLQENRQLH